MLVIIWLRSFQDLTFMSAPERSSLARIRSSRVTSSATVILLVWIWKILRLVFSSGSGNSILRSILPAQPHVNLKQRCKAYVLLKDSLKEGNNLTWSQIVTMWMHWTQQTWTDEGGVKCLYPISSHDYFNVTAGVKSIQLVQELQHGPLDLPFSTWVGVIPTQGTNHPLNSWSQENELFVESEVCCIILWWQCCKCVTSYELTILIV